MNAALGPAYMPADVSILSRDLNYDGVTDVIDVTVTAHGQTAVLGAMLLIQLNYT